MRSAAKWTRASEKRRLRNQDVTTKLKTIFKKAVASAKSDAARGAESAFDKAAARGVIHKNKANRKKSRLARATAKK